MESSARMLDHGAPPERFARGWHCLGLAGRFRVRLRRYFPNFTEIARWTG